MSYKGLREHKIILIAEDNVFNISSLMLAMIYQGSYTPYPICDIAEVKSLFDKGIIPDFAIINMRLRENMGKSILEYLALKKIKIPLVLINARPSDFENVNIKGINIVGYLSHPMMGYGKLFKMIEKSTKGARK